MAVSTLSARYSESPLEVSCATRVVTARSRSSRSALTSLDSFAGEGIWLKVSCASTRSSTSSACRVVSSSSRVSFAWCFLRRFCFFAFFMLACLRATFCCDSFVAARLSSSSRVSGVLSRRFEICRHSSAICRSARWIASSPPLLPGCHGWKPKPPSQVES